MEELIIDESNFSQYFFDVKTHKPQKGQILAKYTATAELVDGELKKDILKLIKSENKVLAGVKVLEKLGCTSEPEAVRVCTLMAEDLLSGMSDKMVLKKVYKYRLEAFYYSKQEYVPIQDPHWTIISIANLNEFVDANNQRITMNSEILDS
jgi:hypothetical protein